MKKLKLLVLLVTLIPFIGFCQEKEDKKTKELANKGILSFKEQQDTIPIEIWNDEILVKLKVNGKEGVFMWDNGFSFSAVSPSFAHELKLEKVKNQESIEANDAIKAKLNLDIKIANTLKIGKAEVSDTPILITDLDPMLGANHKINGVLGASAIKKLNWKFNFDKNYVVFSPKPFEGAGINIRFELNPYNTMYAGFGINGQLGSAEIDFGYNGDDVVITSKATNLFSESMKNLVIGQTSSSVSGLAKIDSSYVIKDFHYVISDTLTTVPHKFNIMVSNSERGVRIGNRFFRNYNCIINFSTNTITLSERKTPINEMPEKSYGFILLKIGDRLKVVIKKDNPNTRKYAELNLQDEIIEVNGKKATDFKNNVFIKDFQINALKNNEKLVLKRADGKIFTLTPENDIYN